MSGFGRRMSMSSIFSSFSAMGGGGGGSEWEEAESVASGESDDLNMVVKPKISKISDDDESWFSEVSDHEDGKKSKKRSNKLVPKKPAPSHKPIYRHNDDDTDGDSDEDDDNNKDDGFRVLKTRKDKKSEEEVDYGYEAAEPETIEKNKPKKKQSARRNSIMQFFQGQTFEFPDDADFSKIETDTEDHRKTHHRDARRRESDLGERKKKHHGESTKKKTSKHAHGPEHETLKKSRRNQVAEESDFDEAVSTSHRDNARSKRHSHRQRELEGDDDIDSSPEPRRKKISSSMSRTDDSDSDDSERQNNFRRSIRKYHADDGHHLCHQSNDEGSKRGSRSIVGEKNTLRRNQSDDGTKTHRSNEEGSKRRARSCDGEKLVLKDENSKRGRRSLRDLDDEKSFRSSSRSVCSRSASSRSISRSRSRLRSRSRSVNVSPKNEKKRASLLGSEETSDDEAEPDFAPEAKNKRKQKDSDQNCESPDRSRRGHRSVDVHTHGSKSDFSTRSPERSTRGHRSVDEHARKGRPDICAQSPERSTRGRRSMEDSSTRGRRSSLPGVLDDPEFSRRRDRSVARSAWREKEKEKAKGGGCNDIESLLCQKAEDSKKSLSRQEILDESRKGPVRSMSRQRDSRPSENRGSKALGGLYDDQSDTDDDLNYDSCSVYGSIAELETGSGMGRRGSYLPTTLGASARRNSTFNCTNSDENGLAMRRPSLREIIKSEVLNPDKSKTNTTQYNFDKIYGSCGPGMGTADSFRRSQSVPRNREAGKHEGAVDDIFKNRRLRGEVDHSRNKKGKNVKEEKKKKTLKDSLKDTFSHSLHMKSKKEGDAQ